jgi:hypothetical protein
MLKTLIKKHPFALKWIGIAFLIKTILFIIFALLYLNNCPPERITNFIFINANDTPGYYSPIESFINSGIYTSFCRMPGLLPIYGPVYFLFGSIGGKTAVIILQLLADSISVYCLAAAAKQIFKNGQIFYYSFFLYAFSAFVSNWDHYGLSDSFSVSFLIFAVYFAGKFGESGKNVHLILAGIFIAWSVFFRPIHGILIPVIILVYLFRRQDFSLSVKKSLIFCSPLLLFLAIWTYTNFRKYNKIIILQGPLSECFKYLSPQDLAIRDLIIAWGGDIQAWSPGSEAEWFFKDAPDPPDSRAIHDTYFTKAYNYDSLLVLRNEYHLSKSDTLANHAQALLQTRVLERAHRYYESYKQEKFFRFILLNRLKMLKNFLLPKRLEDFPAPALSNMNLFEKLFKAFYYLLLLYITTIGFISAVYELFKRNLFALIPLTMILLIGAALGFVEQRYLSPAYPFLTVFACLPLIWLKSRFR